VLQAAPWSLAAANAARASCDRSQTPISSIALWHPAGAPNEVVLAFRERTQADVDVGVLRSLCELDGFARQDLMGAVVDHNRRKAGQISVEHVASRIIPGHARAADPQLAKCL